MDSYIVSARKYRPTTFDSVVGQHALTTTLKNAIATGKLAHAYLFCGPRGVGKTTCARIFAKTINCLHPNAQGEACNECESCKAFNEGRSYNIHELDAASNNSVEDIRALIEQVMMPPQVGRYKVFIIDEVHMLSQAAFNAFLKTLEEPPAHVLFILATTEKHKILPTILSRCQIYDFNRMEVADIVGHLKHVADQEGITYEEEALGVIAAKADGGMRDAMSIFDQVASYSGGNITYQKVIEDLNVLDYDYYFKMTDALLKPDISAAMLLLNEILSKGFGANHFVSGLAAHFRDLLVSRDEQTLPLLEVSASVRERYKEQARRCKPQFLFKALRLCNTCDINYRTSSNKRLLVELTLIEVAQAGSDDAAGSGLGPIKRLKPIFLSTPVAPVQQVAPRRPAAPAATPASAGQTPTASPAAPSPSAGQNSFATPPAASSTVADSPKTYVKSESPTVSFDAKPWKPRTISIHTGRAAAVQTAQKESVSTTEAPVEEAKPFDQNALIQQWFSYAALLPKEQNAIANRMKNMNPTVSSDWVVTVPLENAQLITYMEPHRKALTEFLQKRLHNSHIALKLEVVEYDHKRPVTRSEQLADMKQRHPAFALLADDLGLELD